jgi:hypothetical protein
VRLVMLREKGRAVCGCYGWAFCPCGQAASRPSAQSRTAAHMPWEPLLSPSVALMFDGPSMTLIGAVQTGRSGPPRALSSGRGPRPEPRPAVFILGGGPKVRRCDQSPRDRIFPKVSHESNIDAVAQTRPAPAVFAAQRAKTALPLLPRAAGQNVSLPPVSTAGSQGLAADGAVAGTRPRAAAGGSVQLWPCVPQEAGA